MLLLIGSWFRDWPFRFGISLRLKFLLKINYRFVGTFLSGTSFYYHLLPNVTHPLSQIFFDWLFHCYCTGGPLRLKIFLLGRKVDSNRQYERLRLQITDICQKSMKAINAKFNTHSNSNLVPGMLRPLQEKLVQLAWRLDRYICLSQR